MGRDSSRYAVKVKDAGSPAEAAGYLNLRIKSSKAFPISDVNAIEEIINKVKKMKDVKDRKQQKVEKA